MVTDNISLGGVTTTYTFDGNGNLAGVNQTGTLTTMVYDKENRLKEHKQGAAANTRTFTYDLNSLKQSETAGKATNQLVWDGADMLGEVPAVKPVGAPTMPIRYDSVQGIMFATTRFEPDPTRTDTGADFIGSILIDFDENGDFTAERRYKPYGELLAGTATTYGWTGNTGSRATLLQYSEQYNRRRHYSTKLKQWTTRDPLWPDESAYGYVNEGPLTWADPSGEGGIHYGGEYKKLIEVIVSKLAFQDLSAFKQCLCQLGPDVPEHRVFGRPENCVDLTIRGLAMNINIIVDDADPVSKQCSNRCGYFEGIKHSTSGTIVLCYPLMLNRKRCPRLQCLLLHELLHACGQTHRDPELFKEVWDCMTKVSGC